MWLEISKNAKPNDLALRYLAERWSLGARKEKQPEGQTFVTYIYQAEHLPDEVLNSLATEIKLELDEVHSLLYGSIARKILLYFLKRKNWINNCPQGLLSK